MQTREFEAKVVVITGGAHGLGRGMVELFVEEGATVVFGDIDGEAGEELAAAMGPSCRFLRCDVTRQEDIEALCALAVSHGGRLDVMCNNAGVPGPILRLLDDTLDGFERVLNVNLRGVMMGTQIAGRMMREQEKGSIINVASIAGLTASFGNAVYRSAKAAVIHFTKTAAIDLAGYGIRVNCLVPGQIETKLLLDGFAKGIDPVRGARLDAALREIMDTYQPLKRKGTPRDVANAAAFLAGDRSAYITGAILPVDAGITAGDAHNYVDMMLGARERALSS